MISTLDKMLFREVMKTFLVIVMVLVLLILANSMVRLLGETAAGAISSELMLVLLGFNLIMLLGFVMPPAFFFSILWILGGMYRDSEMAALSSAGISNFRLYRPFIITAIPIAMLVAWLTLWVVPEARHQADVMEYEHAANISLSGIKAGSFNEFDRGNLVIFAAEANRQDGLLKQVFVQHNQNGVPGIVVAEQARLDLDRETGARFVVLEDGHRYQGEEGVTEYSVSKFKEYGVRIPNLEVRKKKKSVSGLSSKALWHSGNLRQQAKLQYRISAPLSVFVLMLLSIPLAKSAPREGVYGRITVAVIIYAIYMNLQKAAEDWMAKGVTPPELGIWWLSVVFVLIALLISYFDSIGFKVRWNRFRRASALSR